VPGEQPAWPAGPLHDMIAGIDAQTAVDAFQLAAVTNIDPGRTGGDTSAAIDAIGAGAREPLALRPRLPAPRLIGDGEALLIQHRRLETRPGAHVGADLLARPAGQKIGRRGEQSGEQIDRRRGGTIPELDRYGRRVDLIHYPGGAGPKRDGEQHSVFQPRASD